MRDDRGEISTIYPVSITFSLNGSEFGSRRWIRESFWGLLLHGWDFVLLNYFPCRPFPTLPTSKRLRFRGRRGEVYFRGYKGILYRTSFINLVTVVNT